MFGGLPEPLAASTAVFYCTAALAFASPVSCAAAAVSGSPAGSEHTIERRVSQAA